MCNHMYICRYVLCAITCTYVGMYYVDSRLFQMLEVLIVVKQSALYLAHQVHMLTKPKGGGVITTREPCIR